MFESNIERTIILAAVVLWFAQGWYLNERLKSVHAKFDAVLIQFDGLREYLYEIDPQFDDERASRGRFEAHMVSAECQDIFAGAECMELVRRKEAAGKRTLNTSFGDRA
jgi:hypothetical protein